MPDRKPEELRTPLPAPPKEMDVMVAGQAHDVREEMYECRANIEKNVFKLGLLLLQAQESGMFMAWGYDNIYEFASAPVQSGGLGIGSRTASRFMRNCQFYIIDRLVPIRDLNEVGHVKLDMMISVIREREESVTGDDLTSVQRKVRGIINRVLGDAKGLSAVDLMAKYIPDMDHSGTTAVVDVTNMSCPHCGKLIGGHDEK